MAIQDGFFDAAYDEDTQEYDRTYNSADFTEYYGNFLGSGVCVYKNPDSMRVSYLDGAALIAPGYLFIEGYWLKNDDFYSVTLSEGSWAILAHLNMTNRTIEVTARTRADSYEASLVLAFVTVDSSGVGTVEDTRYDTEICGVIDSIKDAEEKADYAKNYIDNEIEDRFAEEEQKINAQINVMQETIEEVEAEVNKATAMEKVGTVKFSTAGNLGTEWLLCDGSFVSDSIYPELTALLHKNLPPSSEFVKLETSTIGTGISNGVIYNGKIWLYSYVNSSLYGIDLTTSAIQTIAVSGTDLLVSPDIKPIYFSIANSKLFLTQSYMNSDSAMGVVLIYRADASLLESSIITFSRLIHTTWPAELDDYPLIELYLKQWANHYVVYDSTNNRYRVAAGKCVELSTNTRTGAITKLRSLITFLEWDDSDIFTIYRYNDPPGPVSQDDPNMKGYPFVYITSSLTGSNMETYQQDYAFSVPAFNKKNNDELLYLYSTVTIKSVPNEYYDIVGTVAGTTRSVTRNSTPIASQDQCLTLIHKEIGQTAAVIGFIANGKSGTWIVDLPLELGTQSQNFMDAAVYISELNLWFIFLGTGLLFTQDLSDKSKYGFLSTTGTLGVITKNGYLEYDSSNRYLYIIGQDSANKVVVGRLKMPSAYDWSSQGSFLPNVMLNNIPGYIKAKSTTEA